jgi:hypothetical protein
MKEELNRKRVWDERVCCSTSARYFIVKVFKPFTQSWATILLSHVDKPCAAQEVRLCSR